MFYYIIMISKKSRKNDRSRSKRYRYAAEHLRQCERLEARIDDWQGFESHASFVGRLREAFGQKWSFWQLLER